MAIVGSDASGRVQVNNARIALLCEHEKSVCVRARNESWGIARRVAAASLA